MQIKLFAGAAYSIFSTDISHGRTLKNPSPETTLSLLSGWLLKVFLMSLPVFYAHDGQLNANLLNSVPVNHVILKK